MSSLLITRPKYDGGTHYLYYWSQELIDQAKNASWSVYDLSKKKACKSKVSSYLRKKNPKIAVFNGHGSRSEMLGHDHEPVICKNDNEDLLVGSNVYMRACDAGSELGPSIISAGARGFIGYNQPFIFLHQPEFESRPLEDELAKPFLDCSNQVARALIKGHSAKEAHESSIKAYQRTIRSFLNSESKNGFLLPWLLSNYTHQICLSGNQ